MPWHHAMKNNTSKSQASVQCVYAVHCCHLDICTYTLCTAKSNFKATKLLLCYLKCLFIVFNRSIAIRSCIIEHRKKALMYQLPWRWPRYFLCKQVQTMNRLPNPTMCCLAGRHTHIFSR